MRASWVSSKPTMLRSSGMRRPRARAASMTPSAVSSLPAKIAVGGSGRSSRAAPPATPSCSGSAPSARSPAAPAPPRPPWRRGSRAAAPGCRRRSPDRRCRRCGGGRGRAGAGWRRGRRRSWSTRRWSSGHAAGSAGRSRPAAGRARASADSCPEVSSLVTAISARRPAASQTTAPSAAVRSGVPPDADHDPDADLGAGLHRALDDLGGVGVEVRVELHLDRGWAPWPPRVAATARRSRAAAAATAPASGSPAPRRCGR